MNLKSDRLEDSRSVVKLGYIGVYIFFLYVGTRLNRLIEAVLTCTHDLCFEKK